MRNKMMFFLTMVMVMIAAPANATDYVTQTQFNNTTQQLMLDHDADVVSLQDYVNVQIGASELQIGQTFTDQMASLQGNFTDQLNEARSEIEDQTVLALALAAAPFPRNPDQGVGFTVGVGYLEGGPGAIAIKAGDEDWSIGVAANDTSFALAAGMRL